MTKTHRSTESRRHAAIDLGRVTRQTKGGGPIAQSDGTLVQFKQPGMLAAD